MDDVPLCPPWWPKIIWELHFFPRPPGPGPINLPAAIEDVLELPLAGIWDWVCVLDDVMMYCVHDSASGGPVFFPPA